MVAMRPHATEPSSDLVAPAPESAATAALTRREHRRLAEVLLRAAHDGQPIEPLSLRYPELTVDDAAMIRDMAIANRVADGERVIGAKVAPPARLGWLTTGMVESGAVLDLADLIDPRVEAKLGLTLAVPLMEPVATLTELLARADRVFACLEIVDSRYSSDHLAATDVIADNCGAARLIVGEGRPPPAVTELANDAGELEIDSPPHGSRRAVLVASNTPLGSLVWLANAAVSQRGELQAGALLASPSWSLPAALSRGSRIRADLPAAGRVELTTAH
jgi:2-keto-4-pentenoate hydratase